MRTFFSRGSMSQPSLAPLARYSSIFLLQGGEPIRPGPQLHDEVRADRSELVLLFIGQSIPALVPNPGDVRGALGAVGQSESGRRIKSYACTISLDPDKKSSGQFEISFSTH